MCSAVRFTHAATRIGAEYEKRGGNPKEVGALLAIQSGSQCTVTGGINANSVTTSAVLLSII